MEVSYANLLSDIYVFPITYRGYNIRVFLSGDYEFLSAMYGRTSCASGIIKSIFKLTNTLNVTHLTIGKQPCLWCLVTIDDLEGKL